MRVRAELKILRENIWKVRAATKRAKGVLEGKKKETKQDGRLTATEARKEKNQSKN